MNQIVTLPNGTELLPTQTRGFMVERVEFDPSRPHDGPKHMCHAVLSYANADVTHMPIFTAGIQRSLEKLDLTGVLGHSTQAMILLGTQIEFFQYKEQGPAGSVPGQGRGRVGSPHISKRLYPLPG